MAVFKAFKAFRPSVKNQALIPALPYDVMNTEEAREMVKGNPLSFLHVDKAQIDFAKGFDQYSHEVYEKAKRLFEADLDANGADAKCRSELGDAMVAAFKQSFGKNNVDE